ncbi:hypothetical protein RF11_06067 [Thelohanellus kitauei]|uniref:Uncharacterized protein n=1 Tax=Thelohanellus kitauei TaxID=669202 RepID=A0A0C2MTM0_THEKT|nr:hypothetical protein RF11_06067 [Thelohanellus kitauei]
MASIRRTIPFLSGSSLSPKQNSDPEQPIRIASISPKKLMSSPISHEHRLSTKKLRLNRWVQIEEAEMPSRPHSSSKKKITDHQNQRKFIVLDLLREPIMNPVEAEDLMAISGPK